jgi:hypothetical protein
MNLEHAHRRTRLSRNQMTELKKVSQCACIPFEPRHLEEIVSQFYRL